MVEGARLESVYAGNRIAGSNPASSANKFRKHMNLLNYVFDNFCKSPFKSPFGRGLTRISANCGMVLSLQSGLRCIDKFDCQRMVDQRTFLA